MYNAFEFVILGKSGFGMQHLRKEIRNTSITLQGFLLGRVPRWTFQKEKRRILTKWQIVGKLEFLPILTAFPLNVV